MWQMENHDTVISKSSLDDVCPSWNNILLQSGNSWTVYTQWNAALDAFSLVLLETEWSSGVKSQSFSEFSIAAVSGQMAAEWSRPSATAWTLNTDGASEWPKTFISIFISSEESERGGFLNSVTEVNAFFVAP